MMSPRDSFLTPPTLREDIDLSIAHEMNQPLAAIALHSAAARKWLCRAEPDVERALASLALISEAGCHAGEIVRVIKRHATRAENEVECVNVDQTIRAALRLLQGTLCKHRVETELALNLRGTTIQANRVQLQQVVTNLVVNAIQAFSDVQRSAEARSIRVGSCIVTDQVEITVKDNGPGIEPRYRDRIFRSLFSTKAGNSGVGLPISLDIVRAHHGSITFEPCEPHGALFRVRFPVPRPH